MERLLIQFERWYYSKPVLRRALLGALAAFWVGRLSLQHAYALPSVWARLVVVIVAAAFAVSESFGIVAAMGLLAWMLWKTWAMLATTAATVTATVLLYKGLDVSSSLSRRGLLIARPDTGQMTLLLIAPFLANANIALAVPLCAGLHWGMSGIPTVIGASVLITVVSALQGAHFWAFLLPSDQSLLEITVNPGTDILSLIAAVIPPQIRAIGLDLDQMVVSYRIGLAVAGAIADAARKEFVTRAEFSVAQPLLWTAASALVSTLSRNRTSTASRLFATLAGAVALAIGYYWTPHVLGASKEPYWPGGPRLFGYYMSVAVAVALLPKVFVTGRYRPIRAEPVSPAPILQSAVPNATAIATQASVEPQLGQAGQPVEPEPQPAGPRRRRIEL